MRPSARCRPGPVGEGDQGAGGAVEEHRARRAEQPRETRGKDPPEGLAEHPHSETPPDAHQTARP